MPLKDPEARRVYRAAYYKAHREEELAHNTAYYEAHREEKRVYAAAYYEAHREEIATRHARYNATPAGILSSELSSIRSAAKRRVGA